MKDETTYTKNIYWIPASEFRQMKSELIASGLTLKGVYGTPCETLKAKDQEVRYASPKVFSGLCSRQGSWYRSSERAGSYLVVSEKVLPKKYQRYIDSTISESDFQPSSLPNRKSLQDLVGSSAYRTNRPDDWENIGIIDSLMFKTLFGLTGFWGWGDNLTKHWLNQRANHANFLARHHTVELEGESVPYSVTENDGVCSSCVEFFNIVDPSSRKMVRACPGSVSFAGVKRKKYYDVNPVKFVEL